MPNLTKFHSAAGFRPVEGQQRKYKAIHGSENYTLTYTFQKDGVPGNTTLNSDLNPYGATQKWMIAPLPEDYQRTINYESPVETVFGQHSVLFGNYTMTTVARGCHRIQFVVPQTANYQGNTTAILQSLLFADTQIEGRRYDEVTIFVSPEQFGGAVEGVAMDADIVVSHNQTAHRTPIWLHEYIHTRQTHDPNGEMVWWDESSANYLALRMGLKSGYLSPNQYNNLLTRWENHARANSSLGKTETWTFQTPYVRGSVVLSMLDARLRAQTNGSVTFLKIFNIVEEYEKITLQSFTSLLEEKTSEAYNPWISKYISGNGDVNASMTASEEPLLTLRELGLITGTLLVFSIVIHRVSRQDQEEISIEPEQEVVGKLEELAEDDLEWTFNRALQIGADQLSEEEDK